VTYAEAIAIYNRSSAAERQAVLDRLPTTRRPTLDEWIAAVEYVLVF
jgi:hypothetical protein